MANKNILLWIYAVGIIPLTIFYFSALVIGTFFLLPAFLASLIVYPLSVIGISSSSVFGDYARAVLHIFILISMPGPINGAAPGWMIAGYAVTVPATCKFRWPTWSVTSHHRWGMRPPY